MNESSISMLPLHRAAKLMRQLRQACKKIIGVLGDLYKSKRLRAKIQTFKKSSKNNKLKVLHNSSIKNILRYKMFLSVPQCSEYCSLRSKVMTAHYGFGIISIIKQSKVYIIHFWIFAEVQICWKQANSNCWTKKIFFLQSQQVHVCLLKNKTGCLYICGRNKMHQWFK